jgi:uncharacterized protein (DUF433 family)
MLEQGMSDSELLYINDIPASTIRQRWTVRKVEQSYKRRQAGESTHKIAQDLGTSAQALRAAWRSMGYHLYTQRITDEELVPILELYNKGVSLTEICEELEVDYRRTYDAMRHRGLLEPRGATWSEVSEGRLKDMTERGCSDDVIAAELGRTVHAIRNKRKRISPLSHRCKWTPVKLKRLEGMLEQGVRRDDIARHFQVTTGALNSTIHRHGLQTRQSWSVEKVEELAQRLRDGVDEYFVAKDAGMQVSSLYKLLWRYGVSV